MATEIKAEIDTKNGTVQKAVAYKQCSKCHKSFPLNTYGKDRWQPDGHTQKCRACTALYKANLKARKEAGTYVPETKTPFNPAPASNQNGVHPVPSAPASAPVSPYIAKENTRNTEILTAVALLMGMADDDCETVMKMVAAYHNMTIS